MEKILVPTDLSDHSELALMYAIDLGLKDKAQIILFNEVLKEEELDQANDGLQKEISEIKTQHSQGAELNIEHKSDKGSVLEGINKMLKEDKYDLISMVTHDDVDSTIGSISSKIVQKGKAPSLLVPENNTYKKIENILVVNDFTDARTDEPAFKHLNTLIQKIGAKTLVLQATAQDNKAKSAEDISSVMGEVKAEQNEKISFDTYQDFISKIKGYVNKHNINMIFLPSSQAIFEKIFVGNFSRKLSLEIKIPVYIYF
ncbi:universal stress protein [Catalinimonas niigatensis]|uniref:universal stress protein n=1 Tax=Catalinimonas niigatensis TaxID=1397264 RepID=UPI002664FBD6|nr:universal stress protein [Catalinimonas niigatensis]WPP50212.1 universal stress protein [Catalinimonas niigatensis]